MKKLLHSIMALYHRLQKNHSKFKVSPDIAVVVIALMLSIQISDVNAEKVTIVSNPWCPFICPESAGRNGYIIDIAQEIFERNGYQVQVITDISWKRSKFEVKRGRFNGIAGISISEENRNDFIFSESFGVTRNCFFTNHDNDWQYKELTSLDHVLLGVIHDYGYEPEIEQYIRNNDRNPRKIMMASSTRPLEQLINMLHVRRIQSIIEDPVVFSYKVYRLDFEPFRLAGCTTLKDSIHIGFSKSIRQSQKHVKFLTEGIRQLRAEGELNAILSSYGLTDWE